METVESFHTICSAQYASVEAQKYFTKSRDQYFYRGAWNIQRKVLPLDKTLCVRQRKLQSLIYISIYFFYSSVSILFLKKYQQIADKFWGTNFLLEIS